MTKTCEASNRGHCKENSLCFQTVHFSQHYLTVVCENVTYQKHKRILWHVNPHWWSDSDLQCYRCYHQSRWRSLGLPIVLCFPVQKEFFPQLSTFYALICQWLSRLRQQYGTQIFQCPWETHLKKPFWVPLDMQSRSMWGRQLLLWHCPVWLSLCLLQTMCFLIWIHTLSGQ